MNSAAICSLVGRKDIGLYRTCLATITLLCLFPFWLGTYNPLLDFPLHLERAQALRDYSQDPGLQAMFALSSRPVPNLGLDLFTYVLPLPVMLSGKLFLSVYLALFVYAGHRLALQAHGQASWLSLLLPFFGYQSALLNGFANFVFGQSLFLFTLACWKQWRVNWTAWRTILAGALSCACLLCHVSAFLFLGMATGFWTVWEAWRQKRVSRSDLWSVGVMAPAVFLYFYMRADVSGGGGIEWGSPWRKLVALGAFSFSYRYSWDAVHFALLLAALVVLWVGRSHIRGSACLAGLGALFLGFMLVFPALFLGGSSADQRFAPMALLFLYLSIRIDSPRRPARWAAGLALLAFALRIGGIAASWQDAQPIIDQHLRALDHLPANSRLFVFDFTPEDRQSEKQWRRLAHVPAYAMSRRRAWPHNFVAIRAINPLYYRQPYLGPLDQSSAQLAEAGLSPARQYEHLDQRLQGFTHAWICHGGEEAKRFLASRATAIAEGQPCMLYGLKKPGDKRRNEE